MIVQQKLELTLNYDYNLVEMAIIFVNGNSPLEIYLRGHLVVSCSHQIPHLAHV
jgi:hypothetical protein